MTWTDLFIVFPDSVESVQRAQFLDAFKKANLYFAYGTRSSNSLLGLPTDAPVVMVGERRGLPHMEPPFPFEEWKPAQDQVDLVG